MGDANSRKTVHLVLRWKAAVHILALKTWYTMSVSFLCSFTPPLIPPSTLPTPHKIFRELGAQPDALLPLCQAASQLTGHAAHRVAQRAGIQRAGRPLKCRTGRFSWSSTAYNDPSHSVVANGPSASNYLTGKVSSFQLWSLWITK